jgi:hypothetical protein
MVGDCAGYGFACDCFKTTGSIAHHADAIGQLSDCEGVTARCGDAIPILGLLND